MVMRKNLKAFFSEKELSFISCLFIYGHGFPFSSPISSTSSVPPSFLPPSLGWGSNRGPDALPLRYILIPIQFFLIEEPELKLSE